MRKWFIKLLMGVTVVIAAVTMLEAPVYAGNGDSHPSQLGQTKEHRCRASIVLGKDNTVIVETNGRCGKDFFVMYLKDTNTSLYPQTLVASKPATNGQNLVIPTICGRKWQADVYAKLINPLTKSDDIGAIAWNEGDTLACQSTTTTAPPVTTTTVPSTPPPTAMLIPPLTLVAKPTALPVTGSNTLVLGLAGIAFLVVGLALLVLSSRHRRTAL